MISRKVTVSNPTGLHVRPASNLAKAAESCSSRIEIIFGNSIVNAKSLLNILSATIVKGDEIEIRCIGPREEQDMETILTALQHLE
ncbi:MAG: HPr family phosphocarrier protein [Candidatus Choladocola sp.]|nr:HPr family phosphocarrier protein [Candidatus Choladocola sp.]